MNTNNVTLEDLKLTYKIVATLMNDNKLNHVTAWRHVKSELAIAIANNV